MAQEKLFTLYHGNENDKEIVADNIKDWKQLWEEISEFLKNKNFVRVVKIISEIFAYFRYFL